MKEIQKEPIKPSLIKSKELVFYSPIEETLNIISHGFGLLLSVCALVLLVVRSANYGSSWHIVSFSIFGTSLILLYTASTLYHNAKRETLRKKLNVLDHASIYVLIAGTYTPFHFSNIEWNNGLGVVWCYMGACIYRGCIKNFLYGEIQ